MVLIGKFICTYVIAIIIYFLLLILPLKRKKKRGKQNKELLEIKYLVNKYGLDIKKANYNQLVWIVCFVSSFIITVVVSVLILANLSYLLQLIVSFIIVLPLFIISYKLVSLYYKKKGMIKNV